MDELKNSDEAAVKNEIKYHNFSLEKLLQNNQLDKSEIDKLTKDSQKFENNLKVYFTMSLLNDENERLVSFFRLKLFISNEPDLCIRNCLCVLTNRNIYIFKIKDNNLFEQNTNFDNCLKMELILSINRIEVIETSCGQHCLSIQIDDESFINKFITFDIYQNPSLFTVLLSNS